MKKYIIGAVLSLGIFVTPACTQAAALTTAQSTSLIAVVQSAPGVPASAFINLITSFSNITVNQATSLIAVVQSAPTAPANAFVNLLISFTTDTTTQAANQTMTPATIQATQSTATAQPTTPTTPSLDPHATQPTAPNAPSATIDQSSLVSTSGNPTITGTAENIAPAGILVKVDGVTSGSFRSMNTFGAGVSNGHWSVQFILACTGSSSCSSPTLSSGKYPISVYNNVDGMKGALIAFGVLTVL